MDDKESKNFVYKRKSAKSVIRRKTMSAQDMKEFNADRDVALDTKKYDKETFAEDEQLESALNKVEMDEFMKGSPDYLSRAEDKREVTGIKKEEERDLVRKSMNEYKENRQKGETNEKCEEKEISETNKVKTEEVSLKDKLAFFNKEIDESSIQRKEEIVQMQFIERKRLQPVEEQILSLMKEEIIDKKEEEDEEALFRFADEAEEAELERLRLEEAERQRLLKIAEDEEKEKERQRLLKIAEEERRLKEIEEDRLRAEREKEAAEESLRAELERQRKLWEENGTLEFLNFNMEQFDFLLVTDMSSSLRGGRYSLTGRKRKNQMTFLDRIGSLFGCCGEKKVDEHVDVDILVLSSEKGATEEVVVETLNLKVIVS